MRIMTDYLREALFFSDRLEPRFELVDLKKICATAHDVTAARAQRRNVAVVITLESLEAMIADDVLLQRMLANLLSNAIDASAAGQTVLLTAGSRRIGWVRLQVSDRGCGIAAENITRVFDPYFTTKEFGDELRGFGLGLTICQKIVLLHGGTISVRSEPACGTTFTVDLPTEQNPSTRVATLAHPLPSPTALSSSV
jgi:signal transduction histidine kinase